MASNDQEDGWLSFRVVLPELASSCPSCLSYIYQETCDPSLSGKENCIPHLFDTCLRIRGDNPRRHKVVKWILKYLYSKFNTSTDARPVEIDEHSRMAQLIRQRGSIDRYMVLEVPEMEQCPVCGQYFVDNNTCCYHLFKDCLYARKCPGISDHAEKVWYWLKNFFTNNTKSLTKFCHRYGVSINHQPILCKYCGQPCMDIDSLKEHYETEHNDPPILEGDICLICNFNAPDSETLGNHIVSKHVRSSGHNSECPFCHRKFKPDSDDLKCHVINCKPPVEHESFSIDNLYPICELCSKKILVTKLDAHLVEHLNEDECGTPKRLQLAVENVKNTLSFDILLRNKFLDAEDLKKIKRMQENSHAK